MVRSLMIILLLFPIYSGAAVSFWEYDLISQPDSGISSVNLGFINRFSEISPSQETVESYVSFRQTLDSGLDFSLKQNFHAFREDIKGVTPEKLSCSMIKSARTSQNGSFVFGALLSLPVGIRERGLCWGSPLAGFRIGDTLAKFSGALLFHPSFSGPYLRGAGTVQIRCKLPPHAFSELTISTDLLDSASGSNIRNISSSVSLSQSYKMVYKNVLTASALAGITFSGPKYDSMNHRNLFAGAAVGILFGGKPRKKHHHADSLEMNYLPPFQNLREYGAGHSEPDSDTDGIPNRFDSCPDSGEWYNGINDFDGCSDFAESYPIASIDSSAVLKGVVFAPGTAVLDRSSKTALEPLVNLLYKDTLITLELSGFTDNSGEYEDNMTIAALRLEAVLKELAVQGAAKERIRLKAAGPNDPAADNLTKKGRELNRRIEYRIVNQSELK